MLGVGLAATQIGVAKRMIVIKPSGFNAETSDPAEHNKEYTVMINPQIELSGKKIEWTEACLSLPSTDGKVQRSETATVSYMDMTGETRRIVAEWPYAGGLQHEIDHLDGVLYIQRQIKKKSFSTLKRLRNIRRKEMIKQRRIRKEKSIY